MKKMKNVFALLLAAAMIFSLAACGNNGEEGGNKTAETPTPEYVYTSEYKTLQNGNRGLSALLYTEDGFYYSQNEKVGEMEHDTPAEYEGQYDITEQRLYFMDFNGNSNKLENYEPFRAEDLEEGHEFNSYMNTLLLGTDGNLITIESTWESWSDAPEGTEMYSDEWYESYQYKEGYYLRELDSTGAELSCNEIETGLGDDQYFYPYSALLGDDGMLICCWQEGILALDPATGKKAYEIPVDGYPDKLLRLGDGRILFSSWGEKGNTLTLIDVENKTMGDSVDFPGDSYSAVSGSGEYDLYYTNGTNFYGYKLETQEEVKLFNWISCDVNNDSLDGFTVSADGSVLGIVNTWDSNYENCTTEMVTVTKKPFDPSTQKTVLTLAAQAVDWSVKNLIIDFNRKNDKYRIEVIDYSEYNTEDDYQAGLTKLKAEIMAGNLPDILCLNGMSGDQLAAKGLIEDLYPYMDAESEFGREDFFPNVLAAVEEDGKLYSTVSSFWINTVCGASSVVGDTPGWTYEDLDAALQTMPEGCDIFDYYTTRDQILQAGVMLDMDEYVNWVTGECNFDSEDFIDLLNFANRFPAEFDWDNYEYNAEDDTWARLASGRQMLTSAYVSDFDYSILQYQYIFGGDIDGFTFIGYPSNSGVGSMLSVDSGYAITKDCKAKDGAWEFLRTFFTEEYQTGGDIYNFPSNKNAFNEKLQEAMTPEYRTDADGNYILDEDGNKIEESHGGFGFGNGEMIDIYAMTQEQADKLLELIESTTKVQDYNTAIFDIVTEQTQAFFAGQKSAEEVAKLVQSKANIFVNEQR